MSPSQVAMRHSELQLVSLGTPHLMINSLLSCLDFDFPTVCTIMFVDKNILDGVKGSVAPL